MLRNSWDNWCPASADMRCGGEVVTRKWARTFVLWMLWHYRRLLNSQVITILFWHNTAIKLTAADRHMDR